MKTIKNQVPPPARLISLDLLRTLAIILMLANHVFIYLAAPHRPLPPPIYTFFLFTTFSSALFLFLTGFLLIRSFHLSHHHSTWLKPKLFTAIKLIFISFLLNLLDPHPSHLLSTGILQTIGVLWIIASLILACLPTKIHLPIFLLLLLISVLTPHFLLASHLHLPFVNSFGFPLLPFGSYFFLGLITHIFLPKPQTFTTFSILTLSLIITFSITISPPLIGVLSNLNVYQGFWQPGIFLNLFTLCFIFLSLTFTLHVKLLPQSTQLTTLLSLPGKFSLEIYIFHLYAIYLLARSNLIHLTTTTQFTLALVIVVTITYIFSLLRQFISPTKTIQSR